MAKALKIVGTIAGAVATVASFIPGAQPIAAIAGVVAAGANLGAGLLQKKPPVRGSLNNILIAADAPSPYLVGRTSFAGVLRHDVGWGGRVNKVENPYRGQVLVYSVAGPVDSLESFGFDFQPIIFSGTAATGYYANFLWRDFQLGATPEADALAPQWAGMPKWGASHKLSGKAAILLSLKFDKDGKRYASGVPTSNAVWKGVRCYDPRLDSTYPGGSGAHRIADRTTWQWSENPGIHALTYALGHFIEGKKVFGIGMPANGIDIAAFVAFANMCDANGWTVGGVLYEPGSRKENLARLLIAGGGQMAFSQGKLTVKFNAPRVSLATITEGDLAGPVRVTSMLGYATRKNGIIPRYRSEAHKWESIQGDLVSVAAYVTADGEEKNEEEPYELVQDGDQAAQLAAYDLVDAREAVVECTLKPEWAEYRIGDKLTLNWPQEELVGVDVVLIDRELDPATLAVRCTFMTDSPGKHDFALGRTNTPAPTPTLPNAEERDEASAVNANPLGFEATLISTSSQVGLSITATTTTITINNHTRRYQDKDVSVTGATLTGLTENKLYALYYDDAARAGGAVTWVAIEIVDPDDYLESFVSTANPGRHHGGYVRTDVTGGTGTTGGGSLPAGGGGLNPYEVEP